MELKRAAPSPLGSSNRASNRTSVEFKGDPLALFVEEERDLRMPEALARQARPLLPPWRAFEAALRSGKE